jgi:hypothetical protein
MKVKKPVKYKGNNYQKQMSNKQIGVSLLEMSFYCSTEINPNLIIRCFHDTASRSKFGCY